MKQKDIIFILTPIVIFVFAWIVFSIKHKADTSTISQSLQTNVIPIQEEFDTETIAEIKKRKRIVPLYSNQPLESLATVSAKEITP